MRGEYIATRSTRHPADTDIDPAWTDEAYTDEARVVFDPDYASKTGRSVRTIGYSPTAGFVITVITVVDEGHRRLRKDRVMDKHIVDIEAEASETSRDMAIPADAHPTRPGRASVLSVRLGHDELAALTTFAQQRGIPVSTMARSLIIEALEEQHRDTGVHDAVVRALRETLRPDVLANAA